MTTVKLEIDGVAQSVLPVKEFSSILLRLNKLEQLRECLLTLLQTDAVHIHARSLEQLLQEVDDDFVPAETILGDGEISTVCKSCNGTGEDADVAP